MKDLKYMKRDKTKYRVTWRGIEILPLGDFHQNTHEFSSFRYTDKEIECMLAAEWIEKIEEDINREPRKFNLVWCEYRNRYESVENAEVYSYKNDGNEVIEVIEIIK